MDPFGGPCPKPTVFYGTVPWLKNLKRSRPQGTQLPNIWTRRNGQVTGGPGLKATGHYPPEFGRENKHCGGASPLLVCCREALRFSEMRARVSISV